MTDAQAIAPSASKHHNIITFRSVDIREIKYIDGSFAISSGQPYDLPPVIQQNTDVWTIDMNCGRHKTTPIANGFTELSGGMDYVYNPFAKSDRVPAELNFYLAVR
jgi:hypothetical protein